MVYFPLYVSHVYLIFNTVGWYKTCTHEQWEGEIKVGHQGESKFEGQRGK